MGQVNEARHLDRHWLTAHLDEEREEADRLGEVREAIFGAQDGVTSILIVVITVATATTNSYAVLVAGIAAAIAEVISMAAGEFMSSRSQREIFLAQIEREREEVRDRPGESEAEVAMLLESEGLPRDAAAHVAQELAREPNVLLKTMVEKELGLVIEEGPGALQGALVMGGSFGLASLVPILPYLLLPIASAPVACLLLCVVVVFGIGVVKTRWTKRSPVRSGLEVVALAAFAGIAGYLFGSVLPSLLGFAGLGAV